MDRFSASQFSYFSVILHIISSPPSQTPGRTETGPAGTDHPPHFSFQLSGFQTISLSED